MIVGLSLIVSFFDRDIFESGIERIMLCCRWLWCSIPVTPMSSRVSPLPSFPGTTRRQDHPPSRSFLPSFLFYFGSSVLIPSPSLLTFTWSFCCSSLSQLLLSLIFLVKRFFGGDKFLAFAILGVLNMCLLCFTAKVISPSWLLLGM